MKAKIQILSCGKQSPNPMMCRNSGYKDPMMCRNSGYKDPMMHSNDKNLHVVSIKVA